MEYKIIGSLMESVDIHLKQGESVYTESGGMAWMRGSFDMDTSTKGGAWSWHWSNDGRGIPFPNKLYL